ncbi:GIY-YIG nuclease family protein [Deefgea salmonis]|uniref:GIY-YIG nuclease family protein n=1 Tax=Deefgea salmonis TaxID=2875502 RepID=A0ABS8BP45_9NEIS|nr:GIY-YIG nuclease family protein [Deefgea salmonis]MCB5197502.1 GIY-YIG nuclease family protein [Deefgea salmonis]
MTWFVYILVCRGNRLYTGITTDVERRYTQHSNGRGARYTRAFPPERILMSWPCAHQGVALRVEYRIKQLTTLQKWALVDRSISLGNELVCVAGIWTEVN